LPDHFYFFLVYYLSILNLIDVQFLGNIDMKCFILFFVILVSNFIIGQTMELPIIPVPQEVKLTSGSYKFKKEIKIGIKSEELRFSAEKIQKALKISLNINAPIVKDNGDIVLETYVEKTMPAKNFTNEAYKLSITTNGIIIKALAPKGVFYGAMSLVQLIDNGKNNEIPCAEIVDWPDLIVRGVSDDISRGQVSTLANFKRIIEHIARYKMNTYMPYLEDMIKFDAFPTIGANRGALTKDEIRELVKFAGKYYVDIIPVFQTLGHYENILNQEEFVKYAPFPGAASLDVSNDSIYPFLESMLKEVFELFPSEYFNMGADESYDVGLGNSKKMLLNSDIATIHANHYKKVYDICKKYGKKVMMYGDIILNNPNILSQIPKDIIIVDWHYGAAKYYPSTEVFKNAGFTYYVSPAVWNFLTLFPTNVNAIPNIQYFTESGLKNGTAGMINSNWGDHGAETIKELILYGYSWSAQCAWNYKAGNISDFSKKYFNDFFGIEDDRAAKIYESFNTPYNQSMWHEIWRHPLLPFRDNPDWEPKTNPAAKIAWIENTLPTIIKDIKELRPVVKKNQDHLDILEMTAHFDEWIKLKMTTQLVLQQIRKNKTNELNNQALELIDKNLQMLSSLKKEYKGIWLKYYKPDNLILIEKKFDRMTAYFTEIKELINTNKLIDYSPAIESQFIYVKQGDSLAPKAEFRTTINLAKAPANALLQLIGDSYVKLYINGVYVDKVQARHSLSETVTNKMVKMIDAAKYFKPGDNEIRVEAENFNNKGAAGVNIIARLQMNGEDRYILTHEALSSIKWEGRAAGTKEWMPVVSRNFRFIYNSPNFETGRPSRVER